MIASPATIKTRQRGFTLIELVLVIIIITVASVPLFGMFTQATTSLLDNEDLQVAAQLAQEQAEKLLAQRRALDFTAVSASTTETGIYNGFNRTTDVAQPPPGGCPGGTLCKAVTVSVDKGGPVLVEVVFLLVDY